MFWNDPAMFYASTHQYPLYPGTGRPEERGVGSNIVNAPLPPGAGSAKFRAAITDRVLPALRAFAPDFVLISAGFDRSEEHTSELQSLMRISYAVFCLKKTHLKRINSD